MPDSTRSVDIRSSVEFMLEDMFTFLGAGGSTPQIVVDIGACLIASAVLCAIFVKLKIPVIAAFLVGGVLLGPVGGGIISDQANIDAIAGLGLVLLLFVIGLEINFKKLMASGKALILTGLLQFPLCIGFGFAVTWLLQMSGWSAVQGTYVPLYAGFTAAASSTLLVVKLLQEKFQMDTVPGRVGIGILIFQDIWAIVVLAVQPSFDNPQLSTVGLTFLGTGIVAVVAVLFAKFVLPYAFKWIAKLPELMLVVALGWCFGVATFGENLEAILGSMGIHLHHVTVSSGMGALIAGATIASLPYAHQVVSKVAVVRDFFVTLFFVGLGMGIPAPDGIDVILLAVLFALISIVARYVVFFPLMYYTGLDRRNAFVSSTKLAQVSEFCLVIAYLGLTYGHVDKAVVSAVIFAFVITALITPTLFGAGDAMHDKFGGLLTKLGFKAPEVKAAAEHEHVASIVLLGFHRVASSLLHELGATRPDLLHETLVVDFNVALHGKINKTGAHAHYGDISNEDILQHMGVDKAKVIISTIPDDVLKGTNNIQLTRMLRHLNPEAAIISNAISMEDAGKMYEAGATYVYLSRIATARAVLPAIDAALGGTLADWVKDAAAGPEEITSREEVLA